MKATEGSRLRFCSMFQLWSKSGRKDCVNSRSRKTKGNNNAIQAIQVKKRIGNKTALCCVMESWTTFVQNDVGKWVKTVLLGIELH